MARFSWIVICFSLTIAYVAAQSKTDRMIYVNELEEESASLSAYGYRVLVGAPSSSYASLYKVDSEAGILDYVQDLLPPAADPNFGVLVEICERFAMIASSANLYFYKYNTTTDELDFLNFITLPAAPIVEQSAACDGDQFYIGLEGETVRQYRYNGHTNAVSFVTSFTDPLGQVPSSFGFAIAASENTLIITSPLSHGGNGRAHVYATTAAGGVTYQGSLLSSETTTSSNLGADVDFADNRTIVRANGGSVYVFTRNANNGQWTEQPRITGVQATCVAVSSDFFLITSSTISATGRYTLYNTARVEIQSQNPAGRQDMGQRCALTEQGVMVLGSTANGLVEYYQAVPRAIGGYDDPSEDGGRLCDANWEFRQGDGDTLIEADLNGCLPIDTYIPFEDDGTANFFNEAETAPFVPEGSEVDYTKWCSFFNRRCGTTNAYRPDFTTTQGSCTAGEARRSWGYCMRLVEVASPTPGPTPVPSANPTAEPTALPSASPTDEPTALPSASPTDEPTALPSASPTDEPTALPSASPTDEPTALPSASPSSSPTTPGPTSVTASPTAVPTALPTTLDPTALPTAVPTTLDPTALPTAAPTTLDPTALPTSVPSALPTQTSSPTASGIPITGVYDTQPPEDFNCVFAYQNAYGINDCGMQLNTTANNLYFEVSEGGAAEWRVRCSKMCFDWNTNTSNVEKCTMFIKLKSDSNSAKYGCRIFTGCNPSVDSFTINTGANSAGQRTAWIRPNTEDECGVVVTSAPTPSNQCTCPVR